MGWMLFETTQMWMNAMWPAVDKRIVNFAENAMMAASTLVASSFSFFLVCCASEVGKGWKVSAD